MARDFQRGRPDFGRSAQVHPDRMVGPVELSDAVGTERDPGRTLVSADRTPAWCPSGGAPSRAEGAACGGRFTQHQAAKPRLRVAGWIAGEVESARGSASGRGRRVPPSASIVRLSRGPKQQHEQRGGVDERFQDREQQSRPAAKVEHRKAIIEAVL